jgi:hypothetical protein
MVGWAPNGAADEPPETKNEVLSEGRLHPHDGPPRAERARPAGGGYIRRPDGADLRSRSEAVGAIYVFTRRLTF